MSAAGRGGKRNKLDFYETPDWCVEAIIPIIKDMFNIGYLTHLRYWHTYQNVLRIQRVQKFCIHVGEASQISVLSYDDSYVSYTS